MFPWQQESQDNTGIGNQEQIIVIPSMHHFLIRARKYVLASEEKTSAFCTLFRVSMATGKLGTAKVLVINQCNSAASDRLITQH